MPQQHKRQRGSQHRSERTDVKSDHHLPGATDDVHEVGSEQQERKSERYQPFPDEVISRCVGRHDPQIGQRHCDEQSDNGSTELGRPTKSLLHPDRESGSRDHESDKRPRVIGV